MIMMICPKCLKENYTASPQAKKSCPHCSNKFSIEDVVLELKKVNNRNYFNRMGNWISNVQTAI